MIDRISIELTNQCSKACWFCYNGSAPGKGTLWTPAQVISFARDCALHSVRYVSFGGGEPLEFPGLFDILHALDGVVLRSLTTNGLLLNHGRMDALVAARPDKVHVSLHFPERGSEVDRVVRQVRTLLDRGVPAGVNLLVSRTALDAAKRASQTLREAGLSPEQIVYLPMRRMDTPTPEQIADVSGVNRFQSMSCLNACGASERFCSIGWDKTVAWCSYTEMRRPLHDLSYAGMMAALDGLGLSFCGGGDVSLAIAGRHVCASAGEANVPREADDATAVPAAHSMDTTWFASDSDGHVAMLDSGEPGVVPQRYIEAGVDQWEFSAFEELAGTPATSGRFYIADLLAEGRGNAFRALKHGESIETPLSERRVSIEQLRAEWAGDQRRVRMDARGLPDFLERLLTWMGRPDWRAGWTPWLYALCWLSDESVLMELPPDKYSSKPPISIRVGHHVLAWTSISAQELDRLFGERKIQSFIVENVYPSVHRFGFYMYECHDYNAGPYARDARPFAPIHLTDLPPKLREACEIVRFGGLQFASAERLQPAEHMPCEGWGDTWSDLNGTMHPLKAQDREPDET